MAAVNFLAQLWGYCLIIIPLAFLVYPKSVDEFLNWAEKQVSLMLHGMAHIVLGIAMLLVYHTWDNSWRILITLLGWVVLLSGIKMLFLPTWSMKAIAKIRGAQWLQLALVAIVLFGCFLLYAGFTL